MTNKKIDIWFRFILYFLPLIFIIGYVLIFKSTGGSHNPSTIAYNTYELFKDLTYVPFISDFFTWFKNNVINTQLTNIAFLYCYYVIFVEFALLLKNVLIFIIHVANNFIERGAELGK